MKVSAIGKTVEHDGEVVLVVKELPADCMVLFVSMDVWKEIKDDIEL